MGIHRYALPVGLDSGDAYLVAQVKHINNDCALALFVVRDGVSEVDLFAFVQRRDYPFNAGCGLAIYDK